MYEVVLASPDEHNDLTARKVGYAEGGYQPEWSWVASASRWLRWPACMTTPT
jgi:hypothetical protein